MSDLKLKLVDVNKKALSQSLNRLVTQMNELIVNLPVSNDVYLEKVSIAVQFTAEGGISWIANANTSSANTTTLTFKLNRQLKG